MNIKGDIPFENKPTCPGCGAVFDCCVAVDRGGKPHPGAVSGCVECGAFAMFDDDLQLRPLTEAEQETLNGQVFTKAMMETMVEKYQGARFAAALRHAIFHRLTGKWPDEVGIEDEPIDL